jgi:hypothetical protein
MAQVDGIYIFQAGENVSEGRAVILDNDQVFLFDPTDATHYNRALAVTKGSATSGANVTVQLFGKMISAAFSFTPDLPVFAAASGVLSHTPNPSGAAQYIGVSTAADTLFINKKESLINN